MKVECLYATCCIFVVSTWLPIIDALISSSPSWNNRNLRQVTSLRESAAAEVSTDLTFSDINKLKFRDLQIECKSRGLKAKGTTRLLRDQLLDFFGLCQNDEDECVFDDEKTSEDAQLSGISFVDISDPDFEFNALNKLVLEKCEDGHWKTAVRKLKKMKRAFSDKAVPRETYLAALEACVTDRLHGARASESARKILEEMSEMGYEIPKNLANECIMHCLGKGPGGTHDGFGGIDPALAMISALETAEGNDISNSIIFEETYSSLASALGNDGAVDEAYVLLRAMVVDHKFTPSLSIFAEVAQAAVSNPSTAETAFQILSLVKAAGYELDTVGSAEAGRELLAAGVIAAEITDNLPLGLRLLTAAGKAEGCAPDRGDDLVAASSSAAQRACTLIHKRAIDQAVKEDNWKLAVKLVELMPQRSLTPSTSVLRKVVTICAKCEKSRKATALLLDWVMLYEEGKAEKPPLKVFNTVVNACEICGEEQLTLVVLEAMKKTHNTEGNIVTFNIALKRLAKLGATRACEGIIIGMLQNDIEPNVVTYTTAIGACAKQGAEDPAFALQWLERMKSRNVMPNIYTYNTALASCMNGKMESTVLGSRIISGLLADINHQVSLDAAEANVANLKDIMPNTYTRKLSLELVKQLRDNWRSGDIEMSVAKSTLRVPLLKLVDLDREKTVNEMVEKRKALQKVHKSGEEDNLEGVEENEDEIEYASFSSLHKQGSRVAEV